jgi:glycosyltransferase involved in cell wall biosynthesis
MTKTGYIPKEKRKKIILLSDDLRMHSGIATMAREFVLGTAHHFNWLNIAAAVNHPDVGKRFDLSDETNRRLGINDAEVLVQPNNGYGDAQLIRHLLKTEKPDAFLFFTDPRYWTWLFQIENEVRRQVPMIYLNIWDDLPAPMYNEDYYDSCDGLLSISKQTLNINQIVLGPKTEGKTLKYVPHGINHEVFRPLTEADPHWFAFQEYKKEVLGKKEYDFVWFYNARNIRRKSTSDMFAAWNVFCEKIGPEKAKKCAFVLHTQVRDENGTDLQAVKDLLCNEECGDVIFWDRIVSPEQMNFLYNMTDLTSLISSNEGWGLSLTEALMCGRMILANVTGGMQDQMRFEDENGDWINFSHDFCSNHYGTYKKCGEWALPVWPGAMSIQGSIPTPYIFDDRCDFRDVADQLVAALEMGREERNRRGLVGREWVTSEEAMMTGENMSRNMIEGIDTTLNNFKPTKPFTFTRVENQPKKQIRHKLVY